MDSSFSATLKRLLGIALPGMIALVGIVYLQTGDVNNLVFGLVCVVAMPLLSLPWLVFAWWLRKRREEKCPGAAPRSFLAARQTSDEAEMLASCDPFQSLQWTWV